MEITGNGSQDITTETSEWASRYNISRSSLGPHSAILNMFGLALVGDRDSPRLSNRGIITESELDFRTISLAAASRAYSSTWRAGFSRWWALL